MWFLKLGNAKLRVLRRFRSWIGKIFAKLFGTEISDTDFEKSLQPEFAKNVDFLSHFTAQRSRLFFISSQCKDEFLDALRRICPDAEEAIIRAANTVCGHRFDLLGSGLVDLGWPIDWHSDFKTGHRWNPNQYYAEIRPAPYPGGYDLKVPWELSRCQHFAWLGQAYWLTENEKYIHEFRDEIEDWIRQNRPEYGVNWACSMDIAIRAINWLWGYAFFQDSPILDDEFRIAFCKSLLCHGRHIMANLERTATFAGNHYLSDIVGLIYLGILLPELREARTWLEFGLKELESEMFKQVYPDGGNFEASTNYHRLATELFLSPTLLARLNGHSFSLEYMERLEKMLEFIYQITKPDGTVPVIGDQDNGRLHRLRVWNDPGQEWKDFRTLLAIGCILFNRPEWGKVAADRWEEAIWFYGHNALASYRQCARISQVSLQSVEFGNTGLYIMRADDIYVAVDLGSIGQNGYGAHSHNDTLSFELFASGQTWIQDPGTYVYTSDYKARNLFRSTAFHNTLVLSQHEQNGIGPSSPFRMNNESTSRLLSWFRDLNSDVYLSGELQYMKNDELNHSRSFFLAWKERALIITDWVSGAKPICQLALHFALGLSIDLIEKPYLGLRLTGPKQENVWLFSVSQGMTRLSTSDGWISEGYGLRETASVAYFEPSEPNHKMVIMLPGDESSILTRIDNVLRKEKMFLDHHRLLMD